MDKVNKYREWVSKGRPRGQDNIYYIGHKESKKSFARELRLLDRQYENEQVAQAVKAAEADKGQSWRLVKRRRKRHSNKTTSIKDKQGKVASDVKGMLSICKENFQSPQVQLKQKGDTIRVIMRG